MRAYDDVEQMLWQASGMFEDNFEINREWEIWGGE